MNSELPIRFEAVRQAVRALEREIDEAETMTIASARPLDAPAQTDKAAQRRKAWKAILAAKPLPATAKWWVGDDVLDLLEEAYRQGWGDCYDKTRGESSRERADIEAKVQI